jgi:hypothetical protein
LGVLDLGTFGYALRMRWEWLARTDPSRMWVSVPYKSERIVQALFWEDRWLDGQSIASRAPLLILAVAKRVRQNRLVSEALSSDRWIADITGSLSVLALREYVEL